MRTARNRAADRAALLIFLITGASIATLTGMPSAGAGEKASQPKQSKPKASLYDRLGGKSGVTRLSNEFVDVVRADDRLKKNEKLDKISQKMDVKRVKSRLADRLCTESGGPCKFKGDVVDNIPADLKDAKLSPIEWFYVIDDSQTALDRAKVPNDVRAEILDRLLSAQKSGT